MTPLDPILDGSPYQAYAYSYPHKTAYRPLEPAVDLRELWSAERRDALFLYIHIPFCGMRCGFCNLFTQAGADGAFVTRYLETLRRQAERVRAALGEAAFARCALGGGTPTTLDCAGLETVLQVATETMGAKLGSIPVSVEVSPDTADAEKLALLVEAGADRISIGIETFDESEAAAVFRPQKRAVVARALEQIRASGVRTLNIDLIYGLPGQTVESWLRSIREALQYEPEELYLYPLYVRPLTGLGRSGRAWDDHRLVCYREARALLLAQGYEQVSMRMFHRVPASDASGPLYCCQDDGMVGLGCGARSYTQRLHYASAYAVSARGVRAILADYTTRPLEAFDSADHGYWLDLDEQRRRFVIQSLLQRDGLALDDYARRFGADPLDGHPELLELQRRQLADRVGRALVLTDAGLERSDAIGPWLYSEAVRSSMEAYPWG